MWAAYSLGLVVTPAIGGWIGDHVGLRAVFMLSSLWFVLSTVAISRTHGYPTPERPQHGYNYQGMVTQSHVLAAFGVLTLGFAAVLTGQTLSSQFLEEVRHFSSTSIGVLGSLSALGTAVTSILLGRLSAWRGFFSGLALVMASFGLLLVSSAPGLVAIGMFLLGAHYTTRPLANSVIGAYVPDHQRGMAYGMVDTLAGLATVIGTNVAGMLYDVNPQGPFIIAMIGISVVAALGLWLMRPAHRNARAPAAYSAVETMGD
jgi:predicted MFS family arabinose efflux permease